MRVLDSEYKLRQNIKIAMLYLEDDDSINAELFIKKASSLIASSKVRLQAWRWQDAEDCGTKPVDVITIYHLILYLVLKKSIVLHDILETEDYLSRLQNEELELQYKTSYARILDAKRKFLEASQRYYELSQIGNREINGLQVHYQL